MDINDYSLAVWKNCDHCKGAGKLEYAYEVGSYVCGVCKGHGKVPTFIPLEEVLFAIHDLQGLSLTPTITGIEQLLERQED